MPRQLFPEQRILELLLDRHVMGRRSLQSHLYFENNIDANRITIALKRLTKSGTVVRQKWLGHRFRFHTYALPTATTTEIHSCVNDIGVGHAILESAGLGEIGQDYIRSLIQQSKLFAEITQRFRLGTIQARNGKRIDVGATLLIGPQCRVLVEVKNTYQVIPQKDRLFGDIVAAAISDNSFPILAVSHVAELSKTLCERLGIYVLEMRRQILPNRIVESEIRSLERAFGPERYDFIEPGRPFHQRISEDSKGNLSELVSLKERIDGLYKCWRKSAAKLAKVTEEELKASSLSELVNYLK